jgi:hypothetical protein
VTSQGDPGERLRATGAQLRAAVRGRSVTFVLGAGVSLPYGIPNWTELARRVWIKSFRGRPLPWSGDEAEGPKQLFPIVFELARDMLGERRFASVLRTCLYADAIPVGAARGAGGATSLESVARVLAGEVADPTARRVVRVVTFNADSLLEDAVVAAWHAAHSPRREALRPSPVKRIARPSQQPEGTLLGRIPVYHLHGFVPLDANARHSRNYEHTLVFTDSQYWATTTSLLSLPNTIMGTALHDSTCLFVGLLMTDGNILRWLALRALEFATEREERLARARPGSREFVRRDVEDRLRRHFWIRPAADDPSGLLSDFLAARGVLSVEIPDWSGPGFGKLLSSCFGSPRSRRPARPGS